MNIEKEIFDSVHVSVYDSVRGPVSLTARRSMDDDVRNSVSDSVYDSVDVPMRITVSNTINDYEY
jgi:hypothetical protein